MTISYQFLKYSIYFLAVVVAVYGLRIVFNVLASHIHTNIHTHILNSLLLLFARVAKEQANHLNSLDESRERGLGGRPLGVE